MREIKFRGISLNDNKFVYGSLVYDGVQCRIVKYITNYNSEICECRSVEIKEETVGQYTGLKDKNGTEIYENDVILVKYIDNDCMCEEKIQVISENEKGYSPFNWEQSCDGCDCSLEIKSVEVIGNIYENEKILK